MKKKELTRTAWCKPCRKATYYSLIGVSLRYIGCKSCGTLYCPVTPDQLGVWDELRGFFNQSEKDD